MDLKTNIFQGFPKIFFRRTFSSEIIMDLRYINFQRIKKNIILSRTFIGIITDFSLNILKSLVQELSVILYYIAFFKKYYIKYF